MENAHEQYLWQMKCEIVLAILDGLGRGAVISILVEAGDLNYAEADDLVHAFGVTFPTRWPDNTVDQITPERRRELQELSTSDD